MIRMENVHKAFGSNQVLRGMDLHIPRGSSMVIIGGSGTGKSVGLKCILGLIQHDQGKIFVDGQETGT
jgi:phospholipid/cholesterol/gamma-HCH transport system ATP-binding protein